MALTRTIVVDVKTGQQTVVQVERDPALDTAAAANWQTELAARANEATIRQQAETALGNNLTFLGIASPSTAQKDAQLKALTRQNNGLIRLLLRKLDATT